MSNMNSVAGVYNFSQTFGNGSIFAATIPAAGVYPGYPNPVFAKGAPLSIGVPSQIAGDEFDGHPFKVRLSGTVTTSASSTVVIGLYQCPAASVGTFGTTTTAINSSGVINAAGSPCTAVDAGAASAAIATTTKNFLLEFYLIWDATSLILGGDIATEVVAGAHISSHVAGTALTAITAVAAGDLNFIPTFNFSAGSANVALIREFVIDRV